MPPPNDDPPAAADDDVDRTPNRRLLLAAEAGDAARVAAVLKDLPGADPDACRAEDGATALMLAAEGGHLAAVAELLRAGAAWNLLDAGGHCAAEYSGGRHREVTEALMGWAVEMEELLIEREEREVAEEEDAGGGGGGGGGAAAAAATGARRRRREEEEESAAYLAQRLVYADDPTGARLLDANGDAVMMGWETPIMRATADVLCGGPLTPMPAPPPPPPTPTTTTPPTTAPRPLAVLNVGFGLGIVDRELQRHAPRRHVIVEAHPDVLARMDAEGWPARPGVTVLRGRWEQVLAPGAPALEPGGAVADVMEGGGFGAVYWDTWAQHALALSRFHAWLPRLLRRPTYAEDGEGEGGEGEGGEGGGDGGEGGHGSGDSAGTGDKERDQRVVLDEGGRYSYFNGVNGDNPFFHAVSTQVIARDLARRGFRTSFLTYDVAALGDEVWRGVARTYWSLPHYLAPVVRWGA